MLLDGHLFTVSKLVRVDANPPAEFGVGDFAVADGAFGWDQVAILQRLEDCFFRGGNSNRF